MKTKDPTIKTWCSQIIYIFFNVTEIKQLAPTTFNQKSHVWSDGWILRVPILVSEVAVMILETWLSSVSPIYSTRVNWERMLRQALLWAGQGSAGNSWDVPATGMFWWGEDMRKTSPLWWESISASGSGHPHTPGQVESAPRAPSFSRSGHEQPGSGTQM